MNLSSVSDQGIINTETNSVTENISPGSSLQQRHQTFLGESDKTDLDSDITMGNVVVPDHEPSSRGEYEQVNKNNDKFQGKLLQQQIFPSRNRRRVLRFWIWEVLSVCLAIGLLVAIVLVSNHFHGEIVPQWRFSINLNTLVALLATIARAAMLVAVAEILGQVKWSWFSRPRPLSNLQHFDNASRGLIGSFALPFIASKDLFAVVGSLVVVLSLAIGPFVQQAIKSVDCLQNVSEMNASVPIAHFFGHENLVTTFEYLRVDMKGAMVNALVNPTGNDSKITATCQTGNCTFRSHSNVSYSSIGLCSACIDTTPLIQIVSADDQGDEIYKTHNLTSYSLPHSSGVTIQAFSPGGNFLMATSATARDLSWATSAFTDFYKGVATNSILNTSFLTFTRAPCTNVSGVMACPHSVTAGVEDDSNQLHLCELDYVATSCTLYPCLKNYQASVQQGVLNEQVVSTVPTLLNGGPSHHYGMQANFTVLRDPCVVSDVEYGTANLANVPRTAGRTFTNISVDGVNYTAPEECLYNLDWKSGMLMQDFMVEELFTGTCSPLDPTVEEALCDPWWLSPLYNSLNATFETISDAMDQFAEVVTNKMRTLGSTNRDMFQKDEALGVVTRMTICTAFDWQWLLLPISLVATTALLLILTVLGNLREHSQPVWKSSVLPLIFYGINVKSLSSDMEGPRPVADLDRLDEQASQMTVRFQNGMDAGFVGVDDAYGSDEDIDLDSLLTVEPVRL